MNFETKADLLMMEIGLANDAEKVPYIVEKHLRDIYYLGRRHVKDYLDAIETSQVLEKKDKH